jgi:hypothetical protein
MTQKMTKLTNRLSKHGWECEPLNKQWVKATPPDGWSWGVLRVEAWEFTKEVFGLKANVREKDDYFIIEDKP